MDPIAHGAESKGLGGGTKRREKGWHKGSEGKTNKRKGPIRKGAKGQRLNFRSHWAVARHSRISGERRDACHCGRFDQWGMRGSATCAPSREISAEASNAALGCCGIRRTSTLSQKQTSLNHSRLPRVSTARSAYNCGHNSVICKKAQSHAS